LFLTVKLRKLVSINTEYWELVLVEVGEAGRERGRTNGRDEGGVGLCSCQYAAQNRIWMW
jgi:hypothetical protein